MESNYLFPKIWLLCRPCFPLPFFPRYRDQPKDLPLVFVGDPLPVKINALVLCQLVVYHEVSNEVSKFVKVSLLVSIWKFIMYFCQGRVNFRVPDKE